VIATLSQSQAELPRLVEMASQGEEVVITVDGQPKAKLTRVEAPMGIRSAKEVHSWLEELDELRRRYATGVKGSTVEDILESDRADR
jgi:antitoxin (DNA-binding transcriptional repressor) of toxin-antitoxin stability system